MDWIWWALGIGFLFSQTSETVREKELQLLTRGYRNNNPGNIIKSSITWLGKIFSKDSKFEQFDTMQNGVRALMKLLRSYYYTHKLTTIRQIINKYAPPIENETDAYINAVCREVGIGPDVIFHFYDLVKPLAKAIVKHENGVQAIDEQTYDSAYKSAFA